MRLALPLAAIVYVLCIGCTPNRPSHSLKLGVVSNGSAGKAVGYVLAVPDDVFEGTLETTDDDRARAVRQLSGRLEDSLGYTFTTSLWSTEEATYRVRITGFAPVDDAPPTDVCLTVGRPCETAPVGPPEGAYTRTVELDLAFLEDSPNDSLDPTTVDLTLLP